MRNCEQTKLRKLINEEIEKRRKINQYLDNEDILRYLKLVEESTQKKDLENIKEMLIEILKDFKVTDSNGIYVCTKAYDEDKCAPIYYYFKPKSSADYKCYKDIETQKEIKTDWVYGPSITDFEKSHIVLNPYNASWEDEDIKENGYQDVRLDFFEETYKHGQEKAMQKILKKYPRI